VPLRPLALAALATIAACGADAPGSGAGDALPLATAATCTGGGGPVGSCLGADLLASLGKDHLLLGLSNPDDAAARAAPYDLRYEYLAGGFPDGDGPCQSCASGCTAQGKSCANPGGCSWWGCWQWDALPPGEYARSFIATAEADGQLPMITYYELLQASGVAEGDDEVKKASDPAFMARYLADWRFVLDQVGSHRTLLHVEPDFWGYAAQRRVPCSTIPAAVASANPLDCAGQPDTLAGLGRCMIAMVRRYAPAAKVGLHASGWGTRQDVLMNASASFDVGGEGTRLGEFLLGCGAADGDFIAADMSDRDAGRNGKWWDPTDATLPDFAQALTWGKAVAEAVGRPILWWQIPAGHALLPALNQDNRVDYLLAHLPDVAAGHGVGLAFGAGADGNAYPGVERAGLAGWRAGPRPATAATSPRWSRPAPGRAARRSASRRGPGGPARAPEPEPRDPCSGFWG
jgi:hypothetical protein